MYVKKTYINKQDEITEEKAQEIAEEVLLLDDNIENVRCALEELSSASDVFIDYADNTSVADSYMVAIRYISKARQEISSELASLQRVVNDKRGLLYANGYGDAITESL